MNEMKIFYDSIPTSSSYHKWHPVIEKHLDMKLKLKFHDIIDELSIFCDKYSAVLDNTNYMWTPIAGIKNGIVYPPGINGHVSITQHASVTQQHIEYQYNLTEALELIISDIYEYIFSILVDSNIKSRYYNIFTGREGIALENGLFIENEKILNKKIENNNKVNLLRIIHKRIDFILNPEIRKAILRDKKLKRILK